MLRRRARPGHPTRAWPFLVIALVVYLGAPGTPPGLVIATRDGDVSIERTHAALRATAAPATRGHADAVALPATPQLLPAAPRAEAFAGGVDAAVPTAGRPLTSAAARAPPSPPPVV